jgi:hypothetical protein
MKKQTLFIVFIGLLLTMAIVMGALASGAEIRLPWSVIAGGGGVAQSGDYHMQHTVGQPATSSTHGSSIKPGGGYWAGITRVVSPPRQSDLYLPIIQSPVARIASKSQPLGCWVGN